MAILTGCSIYSDQNWIKRGSIKVDHEKIVNLSSNRMIEEGREEVYHFPETYKCLPGMIDSHIHGVAGADTMDATPEAFSIMSHSLPKEGTTSFLATTITQSEEAIEKALSAAYLYMQNQPSGRAEVLGIHLEGPFINPKRAGAQPVDYIRNAEIELFEKWQELAGGNIRVVTLAPEIGDNLNFIKYLTKHSVVSSIGHSDGSYVDITRAVQAGATQVTHLYNGMKGLHHREPGVLGSAFIIPELYAELICDGYHVSKEMVNLAYQIKGKDKVILITDAMRAKCLKNGVYDLGGQDVYVQDGMAKTVHGTLAGSLLKMKDSIQNMLTFTDAKLEDIVQMGAINPAKQCGVYDKKGSLEIGKDADLIVLNEKNEHVFTMCRGKVAYDRREKSSL
ncbi:N-acetylglucosamine-6-phosphate deacetylase [Terrilactibacillus sp. BCM23-1]|uniref:N-acetylglucosamine-6-phosphate deacetylase n=1 Tax=Terrilactibacillus tamarindi TaxID=2599694 RepID=A0A6N8CU25_9BACI|nr:N-acetylglucosamine-6-phosphate deacetylase [Terrilactibacillus tamarindi]MTT33290.1 N-acetylglucosamine-6-phosphate deacetylase [Terrilactibacillus tamarindi]